jgi:CPA1 family monovalent cation:H+ antiporter
MTFGVVLLAIFIQAVTMSPLLRVLGVVEGRGERNEYEFARGRLQAAKAALGELKELSGSRYADAKAFDRLRESYESTVEETQKTLRELHLDREDIRNEEARWALRRLLQVEKGEVIDALHRGMLNREVYDKLLADIDARLLRLESGEDILTGEETEETE